MPAMLAPISFLVAYVDLMQRHSEARNFAITPNFISTVEMSKERAFREERK